MQHYIARVHGDKILDNIMIVLFVFKNKNKNIFFLN